LIRCILVFDDCCANSQAETMKLNHEETRIKLENKLL
jgi:hypothetical protein